MERKGLKCIIDSLLTVFIFIYLVLGICVFGIATYYNYYEELEKNLVAFVLLATSIVAAAFLFIRIYIDNQLSIKEKEMLKEYSDKVEEVKKDITERLTFQLSSQLSSQSEDMNKKLASQSEDMNKKFASQLEDMNKKLVSQSEDMNKKFASQLEDMNKKLVSQSEDMNKKFVSQSEDINELIRVFNDFIKSKRENSS